jgi:acetyl esterase
MRMASAAASSHELQHLTAVNADLLNPAVAAFLAKLNTMALPHPKETPVAARRSLFTQFASMHGGALVSVPLVRDVLVNLPGRDLPLRMYYPASSVPSAINLASDALKPSPCYLYLHGGGWNAGSLSTHEAVLRRICNASDLVIASLEYRLAPEHPAPAAFDDAVETYKWLLVHGPELGVDVSKIGVAGDSAGANITAAALIELNGKVLDLAHKPKAQFLIYPSVDLTCGTGSSYELFKEGYYLRAEAIRFYVEVYTGTSVDAKDLRVSPFFASEAQTRQYPPTHIVTAGFDPLLSDGEAFATKLRAAGVHTEYTCYTGLIHAFMHLILSVPETGATLNEIGVAMRSLLVPV